MWQGRGDLQSFAEVVSSSPTMGDGGKYGGRGGRGNCREGFGSGREGRGVGRFDRGRGRFQWRRDVGEGESSTPLQPSGSEGSAKWDAAASSQDRGSGAVWVEKGSIPQDDRHDAPPGRHPPAKVIPVPPPPANCMICKVEVHPPHLCPQAYSECCRSLGHLASGGTEFIAGEGFAPMFAFQAHGQGFFYIPNFCAAKNMKDRATCVVIKVVKGEASGKQIEKDIENYLGGDWRCTARIIGQNTYLMRLPTGKDVIKACYNSTMILRSCGATVEISAWSGSVGAKYALEMAWVKVGNVPMDHRNGRTLACVASLVGVLLQLDKLTLNRPDSVRVKISCRNVDEIPPVAEAVLGEHFYDFFFEVDKIVFQNPIKLESTVLTSSDPSAHVPKKLKMHDLGQPQGPSNSSSATAELGAKSAPSKYKSSRDSIPDSQETEGSDGYPDNTLLIESMELERAREDEKNEENEPHMNSPLVSGRTEDDKKSVMPTVPSVNDVEVIPTPPLVFEEPARHNLRNAQSKLGRVEEKAMEGKKRNLEGLWKSGDKEHLERGAKLLKANAVDMLRICEKAHVDLVG